MAVDRGQVRLQLEDLANLVNHQEVFLELQHGQDVNRLDLPENRREQAPGFEVHAESLQVAPRHHRELLGLLQELDLQNPASKLLGAHEAEVLAEDHDLVHRADDEVHVLEAVDDADSRLRVLALVQLKCGLHC